MNIIHEDFVGIYENAISDQTCDALINYYEWCNANNKTWNRPDAESVKKDSSTCINPTSIQELSLNYGNASNLLGEFNEVFWDKCWNDYSNQYSVLKNHSQHTVFTYKLQKTERAGGYHVWHAESDCRNHSARLATYILYLNDVEVGGETEFLYLSKRVPAKKGTLVIFPSNYPWAHRGNPPLDGTKYIMTGWIEFC